MPGSGFGAGGRVAHCALVVLELALVGGDRRAFAGRFFDGLEAAGGVGLAYGLVCGSAVGAFGLEVEIGEFGFAHGREGTEGTGGT